MSERVRAARDGSIAVVTLDYPDRLNVLDLAGWEALAETVCPSAMLEPPLKERIIFFVMNSNLLGFLILKN